MSGAIDFEGIWEIGGAPIHRASPPVEQQQRRGAALAATTPAIQSSSQEDDGRDIALDDHELLPEGRSPEQQKNYRILNGDGGFSSWGRILGRAVPENRPAILRNALIELLPLAESAAVNHVEIADWAARQNECYNIAEPDDLQRIIVEARVDARNGTVANAVLNDVRADRLRPLDLREFLELSVKPREMLLDPILPEKGLAMLFAMRGVGKTFVALGMALAVSSGTKFLKWTVSKPRRVLLADGEMPAAALQERLASMIASAGIDFDPGNLKILAADLIEDGGIGNLASPDTQHDLDQWLDGIDLLILDNLSSLTAVVRDNDAKSWGPVQEWLLKLRRRGISVLIVHHAGKGGQQRGTSRREDVLDTVISLRHPTDYSPTEGARFEVHYEKHRHFHGADAEPFEAKLEVRNNEPVWVIRELADVDRARVQALAEEGLSIRDIAEETGLSKSAVHQIKKALAIPGGGSDVE